MNLISGEIPIHFEAPKSKRKNGKLWYKLLYQKTPRKLRTARGSYATIVIPGRRVYFNLIPL